MTKLVLFYQSRGTAFVRSTFSGEQLAPTPDYSAIPGRRRHAKQMKSLQCSAQRFGEPQAHPLPDICFRSLFLRGSHTNSTLQLTISYPSPPTQFTQNLPVEYCSSVRGTCAVRIRQLRPANAMRSETDDAAKSGLYSFVHTLISVSGRFHRTCSGHRSDS